MHPNVAFYGSDEPQCHFKHSLTCDAESHRLGSCEYINTTLTPGPEEDALLAALYKAFCVVLLFAQAHALPSYHSQRTVPAV